MNSPIPPDQTENSLKESVAWKFASVSNQSVQQFRQRLMQGTTDSKIPMIAMLKMIQRSEATPMSPELKERFSWLSSSDCALVQGHVKGGEEREQVGAGPFLSEMKVDLEQIENNFQALIQLHIRHQGSDRPLFLRVLEHLHPVTLNEFEKYLEVEEEGECLSLASEAWRYHCIQQKLNVLENQDSDNRSLIPWKQFFIMSMLNSCLNGESCTLDPHQGLQSLSLFFDNKEQFESDIFTKWKHKILNSLN